MTLLGRLKKRQLQEDPIAVAVVGAGLIGRGIARQVELMPAMRTTLIVNRTPQRAVQAFIDIGYPASDIVVSDNVRELQRAIDTAKPAVTSSIEALRDLANLDAVVEVTGAVEFGAQVALAAIEGGKHIIMMNAETDATVGCALKHIADEAGVVYTNSDGDQPGVLKRLIDFVEGAGFQIVAAVNCKGFMDVHATPDTIRQWALKQSTSLPMTTAFTDGTKMNIENALVSNATGLIPAKRGMIGVKTDMSSALNDCMKAFDQFATASRGAGLVDYTLGGNFGGGVFVIGRDDDALMVQPLMKYLKMGDGPNYLFFRPFHLCHVETPLSIAEAVLDGEPTIAPLGAPVVEVVAIAKRDLKAGERLDGIGGYTIYGEIDIASNARGLLPVGLADNVRLTKAVSQGQAIPMSAVEIDPDSPLMRLRAQQEAMVRETVA